MAAPSGFGAGNESQSAEVHQAGATVDLLEHFAERVAVEHAHEQPLLNLVAKVYVYIYIYIYIKDCHPYPLRHSLRSDIVWLPGMPNRFSLHSCIRTFGPCGKSIRFYSESDIKGGIRS